MTSRWITIGVGVLLVAALISALTAYAGAVGQAELLAEQLEAAQDSIAAAHETRELAITATDSVIAQSAVIEAEADSAIAVVRAATNEAIVASEAAFRTAVELARDHPVLERAIEEMRAEQIVETMAWEEERAVSAVALFAAQQQIRTLTTTMLAERDASTAEIARLNTALSLSIQESDAWERAAKPGMVKQLWQQGRAAVVVAALVMAVR